MDNPHTVNNNYSIDAVSNATQTNLKAQEQSATKRFTPKKRKFALIAIVFIFLVAGTTTGIVLWNRSHPKADSKQEALQLVDKLKDIVDLPTDETPSIAEVKDVTKLSDQPFYNIAQNGDKVLVYQKAGKALLYRPSTKKVIEYTPVNIDDKQ